MGRRRGKHLSGSGILIRDLRNGSWAWVNYAVFSDTHLTDADVRIYGALATFGGCLEIRPSIRQIAERSSLTERAARRCISRLEKVGYLAVKRGGGDRPNTYELLKAAKGCLLCRHPLTESTPLTERAGVTEKTVTPDRKSSHPLTERAVEEDNEIKKGMKQSSSASSEGIELARLLTACILENNPKAKPVTEAKLFAWAAEADRMLRLDKRVFGEARELLEWSQRDLFWKTNILSFGKFREKYDQLWLKHQQEGGRNGTASRRILETPDWDSERQRAEARNGRLSASAKA